jgi:PadR family transcriptional regulator PadR
MTTVPSLSEYRRTPGRKQTVQTLQLLHAFVGSPLAWRYGYELSRVTGLRHGTIYPQLERLESAGLLDSRWEASKGIGSRQRHMFRLTRSGIVAATDLLSKAGWC